MTLRVVPSPGPPASWSLSLVDYAKEGAPDLGVVECGKPFYLEVQALDAFSNKWVVMRGGGG